MTGLSARLLLFATCMGLGLASKTAFTRTYQQHVGYSIATSIASHWQVHDAHAASCLPYAMNHGHMAFSNDGTKCTGSHHRLCLVQNATDSVFIRTKGLFNETCHARYFNPEDELLAAGTKVAILKSMNAKFKHDNGMSIPATSTVEWALTSGCSGYAFDANGCTCCPQINFEDCIELSESNIVTMLNSTQRIIRRYLHCRNTEANVHPQDYLAVQDWAEWSECDDICGGAHRSRSRYVIEELREDYDETEVEVCNDQTCERPRTTCNTGFKKLSGLCKPN